MLDFLEIGTTIKKDIIEVYPEFIVNPDTKDLMIRGGDFSAVWNEAANIWSRSEGTVIKLVDNELRAAVKELSAKYPSYTVVPKLMKKSRSGSIDIWHKFVQKQMRDCGPDALDEKVIFANQKVKKTDYASHVLPYALEEGDIGAYEELISTLYSPEERAKLEWAIGAIISGDAKHIQKFEVLYGDKGTGKSTILNIIEKLFDGYVSTFNAKDLGSASNAFALESFKSNPLVSIQHDGDLSRIEDNTKLNSIVSHERIEVNAKYTKIYTTKFNTFLFMGTNKPVKITDAKSGILRRLIDVHPSGNKIPYRKYLELKNQINFELGAIAFHCLNVYEEMGEAYYENYIPREMMSATNDFYDFVEHNFDKFVKEDQITLAKAWPLYREYCEFAGAKQLPMRIVRVELRNYFRDFKERATVDGKPVRNLYFGFRSDKFETESVEKPGKEDAEDDSWLKFNCTLSRFDDEFADWPAQLSSKSGNPYKKWADVKTTLAQIDTSKEHWVKPPEVVICVDFDICDRNGNKDFEANLKAASKWPKTYAELSRSGVAIHLYYIYDGDVSELSSIFDDKIEIKTFQGNASLRRKVTKCNNLELAHLKRGYLPLKGEAKVVNWDGIKNEKMLRAMIKKNLRKEYHADTTSSVDYIKHLLDMAYESGIGYDVSDMQQAVLIFAMNSTHQKEKCVATVAQMKFKSEEIGDASDESPKDDRLVFFDCEVYQNFSCICWKYRGSDTVVKMPDPTPSEVEELFHYKLVGFNCRQYDNHILLARSRGYSNMALYELSQQMINEHTGFMGEAYNISYTDVFDFCTEKKGLKKWEIALKIDHQEMSIPWDEPVPEDMKEKVMEYCANDVIATEKVFEERYGDFLARQIQVDLVHILHGDDIKVTVNDTTNTLSKRIIFGNNRNPQVEFNYRDLSQPVGSDRYEEYVEKFGPDYKFRVFNSEGLPEYRDYIQGEVLPEGWSILPFFKGYDFDEYKPKDKSLYLGEVIGEGGRVYSVPGYYEWVWDGDINSQHPSSTGAEVLFGPRYTKIYMDIVNARIAVKHKDFEKAGSMLGGALKPYLNDETYKDLAQALKIVINSVYGLTKAGFKNEFRDPRNKDNIVAKRGALFMTLLKREVEKRGYLVCHIKTDSIKIPHADDKIKKFVYDFGLEFGYVFDTEAVFDKFCLLNDAAYVGHDVITGEWFTKADQFKKEKQPYLFKTLFSHEPYELDDFCETKSVTEGALYLDMNEDLPDVSAEEKAYDKLLKKLKKEGCESDPEIDILKDKIAKGHNYVFVGRVGRFTPVVSGAGGGYLYRIKDGQIAAASGTTGYRWLESANVKERGKDDLIDKSYYTKLVDKAKEDIGQYVDVEYFISDERPAEVYGPTLPVSKEEPVPDFMNIPDGLVSEEMPFG